MFFGILTSCGRRLAGLGCFERRGLELLGGGYWGGELVSWRKTEGQMMRSLATAQVTLPLIISALTVMEALRQLDQGMA